MADKTTIVLVPALAEVQVGRISKGLNKELFRIKEEVSSLPKGKLYIRNRNNRIQFNHRLDGKVIGITNFPEKVYELARSQYLQLHMQLLEQLLEEGWTTETKRIISTISPQIEELLNRYESAGLDIERITMTVNQRIWNSERHSQKENRKQDLIYPTRGGIYMRTMSERSIGNLLEELHIPYRYETRITINNRSYHPDFTIMLPDGRLVILEHVGRMDLKEYNEDLIYRLQAYNSIGLMIGRHVFMTFSFDVREEARVKEVLFQMLTADPPWNKYLVRVARSAGCKVKESI